MKRKSLPGPHVQRHGLLEYTGTCYACGVDLRDILAEEAWEKPFAELALEHLNRGGSLNALADMCGVHRQAMYAWLERAGIERRTIWRQREEAIP